eukprot:XP_001701663.1 hypothetical protein CHLREDRAFT_166206 [Chlamydomonas reinhardtii]
MVAGNMVGAAIIAVVIMASGLGASAASDFSVSSHSGRGLLTTASGFPWCQCIDYSCACSPYKVNFESSTQSGSLTTTCFSVAYIGCDTSRACCRGMLAAVDKLTFETTAACGVKSNIANITINGKRWPSWNPYPHPSGPGTGYELKIYNLKGNNGTFPGSKICITTKAPCSSLKDLCSSSPSGDCTRGAFCCKMDFAKMELPITTECKPELRRILINNEATTSYSWGFYDAFTTLKFPSLTKSLPAGPDGATLCWVVRPGACADPANFCLNGRCQVNIFSSDNKCCPATIVQEAAP